MTVSGGSKGWTTMATTILSTRIVSSCAFGITAITARQFPVISHRNENMVKNQNNYDVQYMFHFHLEKVLL